MPSSPNYKRDYKQEYATESKARRKHRAERNRARRIAAKAYGKEAIKGKDIDHIKPLDQGGKTTKANIRPRSPRANRSYARTPTGQMKRGRSR